MRTYKLYDIRPGGECELHCERVNWRYIIEETEGEHTQYTGVCIRCAEYILDMDWKELAGARKGKWGV